MKGATRPEFAARHMAGVRGVLRGGSTMHRLLKLLAIASLAVAVVALAVVVLKK